MIIIAEWSRIPNDGNVIVYTHYILYLEFSYDDVFRLWETIWAARITKVTTNFEEFFALAIMKQFK